MYTYLNAFFDRHADLKPDEFTHLQSQTLKSLHKWVTSSVPDYVILMNHHLRDAVFFNLRRYILASKELNSIEEVWKQEGSLYKIPPLMKSMPCSDVTPKPFMASLIEKEGLFTHRYQQGFNECLINLIKHNGNIELSIKHTNKDTELFKSDDYDHGWEQCITSARAVQLEDLL